MKYVLIFIFLMNNYCSQEPQNLKRKLGSSKATVESDGLGLTIDREACMEEAEVTRGGMLWGRDGCTLTSAVESVVEVENEEDCEDSNLSLYSMFNGGRCITFPIPTTEVEQLREDYKADLAALEEKLQAQIDELKDNQSGKNPWLDKHPSCVGEFKGTAYMVFTEKQCAEVGGEHKKGDCFDSAGDSLGELCNAEELFGVVYSDSKRPDVGEGVDRVSAKGIESVGRSVGAIKKDIVDNGKCISSHYSDDEEKIMLYTETMCKDIDGLFYEMNTEGGGVLGKVFGGLFLFGGLFGGSKKKGNLADKKVVESGLGECLMRGEDGEPDGSYSWDCRQTGEKAKEAVGVIKGLF